MRCVDTEVYRTSVTETLFSQIRQLWHLGSRDQLNIIYDFCLFVLKQAALDSKQRFFFFFKKKEK